MSDDPILVITASQMALVVAETVDDNGKVSGDGMEKLEWMYSAVEEEDRADTFNLFIGMLENAGIYFDKEQWNY